MDYKNFKETTDYTILERGKEYFDAGAVNDLEKHEGCWVAQVDGTYEYSVAIYGLRRIKKWDCDCPFDKGPVCKHVIAVLYAIQVEKTKAKKSKKTKVSELDQVFDKVPEEELLEFFRKKLRSYKNLKQELLSEFMEYVEVKEGADKYTHLIKQMIKSAKSRKYGFIDYKASRHLAQQLNGVILKAQLFLQQKNYLDALAICKAILVESSNALNEADDSGGDLQYIMYSAYNLLSQLLNTSIPPNFKDDIFQTLLEILQKDKSNVADIRYRLLDILMEQDWEKPQYARLLDYLQTIIKSLTGGLTEYRLESYLKYIVQIYERMGEEDKLHQLEQEHLHLTKIRQNVVKRIIDKGDYDKAKELVNEGIKIAKAKDRSGTVLDWKDKLILISDLEEDIPTKRALLKEQYFDSFRDREERLQLLKKSYAPKEWLKARTALIKELKGRKNGGRFDHKYIRAQSLLSELYIAEEMWEDLLKFLDKKSLYPSEKVQLAYHLQDHYPEKVIEIYADYVREMGEASNSRKEYKKVVKFLKGMLTVKGSQPIVTEIVKEFRKLYERRPAMIDELRKSKL